eukprot:TRINITY_DN3336_c0_g1_i3.p2 TRINITY_DN3336_c0_g1~~TRINITY_DN3336_c0_g1_i3.p2  ORF type:complete len:136 (+),score=44.74 TRINITY_DN3336_c0_g1_i3:1134-1541(+)
MKASQLWEQWLLKYGQGANMILNVPPNSTGVVPQEYMNELRSFYKLRIGAYQFPVAMCTSAQTVPCDGSDDVRLNLGPGRSFNQIVLMEDLAQGQSVSNYSLRAFKACLLYTSDAADEEDSVDLGGRRIIKKKKK